VRGHSLGTIESVNLKIPSTISLDSLELTKGIAPFFLIMAIGLIIIYLIPQLSLFLPNVMMGK
jgi:TRAP-type C4-dicarboxylate transport system permease large subunit